MESEVQYRKSSYTHTTILPATGATESGRTRARFMIGRDKSEAKRNKYSDIALSTQQVELKF